MQIGIPEDLPAVVEEDLPDHNLAPEDHPEGPHLVLPLGHPEGPHLVLPLGHPAHNLILEGLPLVLLVGRRFEERLVEVI